MEKGIFGSDKEKLLFFFKTGLVGAVGAVLGMVGL